MNRLGMLMSQAAGWLLDPPSSSTFPPRPDAGTDRSFGARSPKTPVGSAVAARTVVAVVGIAPGSGASTLARALAATLARRDPSGAAILIARGEDERPAPAVRAASRLAGRIGTAADAVGRLCIVNEESPELAGVAPVVIDAPSGAASSLLPDLTILVVPGDAEPALAELAAKTLRDPVTVVNRASDSGRWDGRAFAELPHSRSAAWLAAAGWEPRGAFGAAISKIADACEEAACA
ncbi:MAG TPA: hypothetical protein VF032_10425 [Thermoleophilaceae bacterium]